MIFPAGSVALGLLGAYFYEIYQGHSIKNIWKKYAKAYLALFLLYLLFLIISPEKAHAFCENCTRMTLEDQDMYVHRIKTCGAETEIAYLEVKKIEAEHEYGIEDLYIATLSAGITACYLDEPRAIMVTVVLSTTAAYFNSCYSCHQACRSQANLYRFYLFYTNAYSQQLVEGRIWCENCFRLYKLYHYQGEIDTPFEYCRGNYGCPHKRNEE